MRDFCDCGGTLEYQDDLEAEGINSEGWYVCKRCGQPYPVEEVELDDDDDWSYDEDDA